MPFYINKESTTCYDNNKNDYCSTHPLYLIRTIPIHPTLSVIIDKQQSSIMSLPTLLVALTSALLPLTSAVPTASGSGSQYQRRQQAVTPETFQVVGNSGVSAQMMFNP